jgi:anaerobic dimethyl sulfoxide reductase subunit B (iron-sulfur subunit)
VNERVFVIDLTRCTGCQTCAVACRDRADVPDHVALLRVETTESGTYPNLNVVNRVIHCFHCGRPACVDACPTGAIEKQSGGLVAIERGRCSGCGECLEACPFHAVALLPSGIAVKCDGCADEVAAGWDPTCVRSCPMRALDYVPPTTPPFEGRVPDAAFRDHSMEPAVLFLCWPRQQSFGLPSSATR